MPRHHALFVLVCTALWSPAATFGAEPSGPITVETLLARMSDLSWLSTPPQPGERTVQFSSYDRASRLEGDTLANPFANGDRGHYLRVDTLADGSKEHVLAEAQGPGFVSRIWSANPAGIIRIYIDGATEPVLEADFVALTHGKVEPFTPPFGHESSRGCNLYFPIPFARSIKVVTTEGDQYFQVQMTLLAPDSAVESYTAGVLARSADMIAKTRASLRTRIAADTKLIQQARDNPRELLAPGARTVLLNAKEGPATLEGLSIKLASDNVDEALARCLLTITFDGADAPQVAVPLGDFFGSGPGINPFQSVPAQVTDDGVLASFWPMPYSSSVVIAVVNQSEAVLSVSKLACRIAKRPAGEGAQPPLHFHARWKMEDGIQTVGGDGTKEWQALALKGAPGRFVGLMLNVFNPTTAWWGEGDEKIYIDGEAFPSTFGTGTEDYFGYAWCDPHPYVNPFHAQTRCDGPGNRGNTSNVRFQILDQIPWHESIQFDLEVWHWKAVKVQYATIAYFYAAEGAVIAPSAEFNLAGRVVHSSDIPIHREPNAIEAESLPLIDATGAVVIDQGMENYGEEWSSATQRWWVCRQPQGRISMELPEHPAGTFELVAGFTRAPDYGSVQVAVGDKPLGDPVDLYARNVSHSGPLSLGRVRLDPEDRELSLTITGKNPKSTSYLVGIDYFKLIPIEP